LIRHHGGPLSARKKGAGRCARGSGRCARGPNRVGIFDLSRFAQRVARVRDRATVSGTPELDQPSNYGVGMASRLSFGGRGGGTARRSCREPRSRRSGSKANGGAVPPKLQQYPVDGRSTNLSDSSRTKRCWRLGSIDPAEGARCVLRTAARTFSCTTGIRNRSYDDASSISGRLEKTCRRS